MARNHTGGLVRDDEGEHVSMTGNPAGCGQDQEARAKRQANETLALLQLDETFLADGAMQRPLALALGLAGDAVLHDEIEDDSRCCAEQVEQAAP